MHPKHQVFKLNLLFAYLLDLKLTLSLVAEDETGSQAADEAGSQVSEQPVDEKPKKKEKLIKNQFNYQDRGTQSGTFLNICCHWFH